MADDDEDGERAGRPWAGADFNAIGTGVSRRRPTISYLVRPLKAAFRVAGADVRRLRPAEAPIDLRGRVDHPSEALHRAAGRPFVMDVPLDRLRMPLNFRPLRQEGAPMVEVAHRVAAGASDAEVRAPFATFYDKWQPRSRADFYAIPATEASSRLRSLPPWAPVGPWTAKDPVEAAREMAITYRVESAEHGRALGVAHGHLAGGPWSDERIAMETRRMAALVRSVRADGFRRDSVLTGLLVIGRSSAEWAVVVLHGQHRASAAEAMQLRHLPISFDPTRPPVRREESPFWPLVRDGMFTETQAIRLVDRMLAAEPTPGCPHPASPDRLGWQAGSGNVSRPGS